MFVIYIFLISSIILKLFRDFSLRKLYIELKMVCKSENRVVTLKCKGCTAFLFPLSNHCISNTIILSKTQIK